MKAILILHNTFGDTADPLYESRAAVMDQVHAVEAACDAKKIQYTVLAVENLRHLTTLLAAHNETLVFNLAEEFLGDVRQACFVPAVCAAFGKSCTGNDTPTLLLAQNKIQAKALLSGSGLPVASGSVVAVGQTLAQAALPSGTYILKPAYCDASEGITIDSVVRLPQELARAESLVCDLHRRFAQPVIVEQYIPSHELNVSVMEENGQIKVMPLAEIDFSAFPDDMPRILDYSAKWHPDTFTYQNTPRKIPAEIPEPVAEQVRTLAVAAWKVLGCRDYTRVDFRLDEQLNPYIIEINPNPDISPEGGFAAAIAAGKIRYKEFIKIMLDNAKRRLPMVSR